MIYDEDVEKARQAIMRFRELLDIMRVQLEDGERAYAALFAALSPEEKAGLKEKDRQGLAAYTLLEDRSVLGNAAGQMRFAARNLEHDFEQLYDNIMTE